MKRGLISIVAAALGTVSCVGGAVTVEGDIRDDGIMLAKSSAPAQVRYELHNVGLLACEIVVAYTSVPVDRLPVRDGRVVLTDSDAPDAVRPDLTYESPPDYTLGRLNSGETRSWEVALERSPEFGERVILCNAVGDYERGRYTVLRFDR